MQVAALQQRVAEQPEDSEAWELLVDDLDTNRGAPGAHETLLATLAQVTALYPAAVRARTRPSCSTHACARERDTVADRAGTPVRRSGPAAAIVQRQLAGARRGAIGSCSWRSSSSAATWPRSCACLGRASCAATTSASGRLTCATSSWCARACACRRSLREHTPARSAAFRPLHDALAPSGGGARSRE